MAGLRRKCVTLGATEPKDRSGFGGRGEEFKGWRGWASLPRQMRDEYGIWRLVPRKLPR